MTDRLDRLRALTEEGVSLDRAYREIQDLLEQQRLRGREDPWISEHKKERQKWLAKLELVLLRMGVHGPSVMYESETDKIIQWMRRNWRHGYFQILEAERDARARRQQKR